MLLFLTFSNQNFEDNPSNSAFTKNSALHSYKNIYETTEVVITTPSVELDLKSRPDDCDKNSSEISPNDSISTPLPTINEILTDLPIVDERISDFAITDLAGLAPIEGVIDLENDEYFQTTDDNFISSESDLSSHDYLPMSEKVVC